LKKVVDFYFIVQFNSFTVQPNKNFMKIIENTLVKNDESFSRQNVQYVSSNKDSFAIVKISEEAKDDVAGNYQLFKISEENLDYMFEDIQGREYKSFDDILTLVNFLKKEYSLEISLKDILF
jgi:hypothetical protein